MRAWRGTGSILNNFGLYKMLSPFGRKLCLLVVFTIIITCATLIFSDWHLPFVPITDGDGDTYTKADTGTDVAPIGNADRNSAMIAENSSTCLGSFANKVEDLFCVKRPTYLPNYKNPCWYEDSQLQCLPYFMLLGVSKAGTDDLYSRILAHREVLSHNMFKESMFWSRRRYFNNFNYAWYKSVFVSASRKIETKMKKNFHPLIVGDASPTDFADFRGWQRIPQNTGLEEPQVLTPDLINYLYRKPRFIVLLRNPAERLYSQFHFLNESQSPESFHVAVEEVLGLEEECRRNHTVKQCLFRSELDQLPVRLYIGCYSVFLREWLRVFPRESFLILRSEDYKEDIKGTVKEVYDFLDLPYNEEKITKVSRKPKRHRTESKHKAGPMLNETRTLLYDFYRNYSRDLATILGDKRYLWEDNDDLGELIDLYTPNQTLTRDSETQSIQSRG